MKVSNVFLCNFYNADAVFYRDLKSNGINIIGITSAYTECFELCRSHYPDCLTLNSNPDVIQDVGYTPAAEKAGINLESWDPVKNAALPRDFWLNALTLATRHYKTLGLKPVQEKVFYIYKCLSFWYSFLKSYDLSAVFFYITPHELDNYVMYHCSKLLGVPIYIIHPTLVKPLCLIETDIHERKPISSINCFNEDKKVGFINKYLNSLSSSSNIAYLPEDAKKYSQKLSIQSHRARMLSASPSASAYRDKSFCEPLDELYFYYQKQSVSTISGKKFIYFPLHFQPEETTSPRGGFFSEQRLAIQILSSSMPSDWVLAVKEHPMQFAPPDFSTYPYRSIRYYQDILKLKNTVLVNMDIDSSRLIDGCSLVATITGTAGLEGLLKKKPVVVFGTPWYIFLEGVTQVKTYEECVFLFRKLISSPVELPTIKDIRNSLIQNLTLPLDITVDHPLGSAFDSHGKIKVSSHLIRSILFGKPQSTHNNRVVYF